MSWLDDFFRATRIKNAGNLEPAQPYLDIQGDGAVVTDDPANGATKVVIAAAGGWKVLFDHAYSADPTTSVFAVGANTLGDGKAWTYQKQNTPANRQVTNGAGIVLGGTGGAVGTLTAPLMTLAPTLSCSRPICVDIHMTHVGGASDDYMVGMTDTSRQNPVPDTGWNNNGVGILARQGISNGVMKSLFKYDSTEGTIYSSTASASHDVFRFLIDGPNWSFLTSLWSSGWPSEVSFLKRGSKFWTQTATTPEQVLNADLGIVLASAFAAGVLTVANIRIREG